MDFEKQLTKKDITEKEKELLIHTIEDNNYQINSSKEIIKLIQSLKVKERNKNAKKQSYKKIISYNKYYLVN